MENKLHKIINGDPPYDFTEIPNEFLRNPEIKPETKIILSVLLSNEETKMSHFSSIKKFTGLSDKSIRLGLSELEKLGYLKRIKYQDKKSKKLEGSFLAITNTPHIFNINKAIQSINELGLEIIE